MLLRRAARSGHWTPSPQSVRYGNAPESPLFIGAWLPLYVFRNFVSIKSTDTTRKPPWFTDILSYHAVYATLIRMIETPLPTVAPSADVDVPPTLDELLPSDQPPRSVAEFVDAVRAGGQFTDL